MTSKETMNLVPSHENFEIEKKGNDRFTNQTAISLGSVTTNSSSNPSLEAQESSAYLQTNLFREFIACASFFLFGMYSPLSFFRPIIGINMRPIPYQILKSGDVVLNLGLNNALVTDVTVPSTLLLNTSITLPLIFMVVISQLVPHSNCHNKFYDTHACACVLFLTIGLSEFTTQMVKMYVGRLRPNFYELCGFDAATLQCAASESHIMESRSSFPSGHSSLSAAGMGVLVWFALGRANIGIGSLSMNGRKRIRNPTVSALFALLPMGWALFVASSRLVDNWHHPSDIVAGLCIGIVCPTFVYHLYYPSVLSAQAGVPLNYIASVSESASCEKNSL
jgi:membrane-associated phospholipid phosphatase